MPTFHLLVHQVCLSISYPNCHAATASMSPDSLTMLWSTQRSHACTDDYNVQAYQERLRVSQGRSEKICRRSTFSRQVGQVSFLPTRVQPRMHLGRRHTYKIAYQAIMECHDHTHSLILLHVQFFWCAGASPCNPYYQQVHVHSSCLPRPLQYDCFSCMVWPLDTAAHITVNQYAPRSRRILAQLTSQVWLTHRGRDACMAAVCSWSQKSCCLDVRYWPRSDPNRCHNPSARHRKCRSAALTQPFCGLSPIPLPANKFHQESDMHEVFECCLHGEREDDSKTLCAGGKLQQLKLSSHCIGLGPR